MPMPTKLLTKCRVALSPLYLERIRHYESHAPGDDWDGVWTMQNK